MRTSIGFGVSILLLLTLHQEVNPVVFASCRVGLLLLVVWMWHPIVDLLISYGIVHPMRRDSAIAFRWKLLVLVGMLELLVIQQVPALLRNALRD